MKSYRGWQSGSWAVMAALCGAAPAWATPILGSAQSFSVLGATTVTNTGSTTLWGDLGLSPPRSAFELRSYAVTGTVHQMDAVAVQARTDAAAAYHMLAGQSATRDLSGTDLGGMTLTPGIYHFSSSAQLTGTLTLDTLNNPHALFVFQIGNLLTTASNSVVNVINALSDTAVFWQVGSSATLGTGTVFAGNILADQGITMDSAAKILCGRAIALNDAVTLDNNTVSNDCLGLGAVGSGRTDGGSGGFSGSNAGIVQGVRLVPEPSSLALAGLALASMAWVRRRRA